MPKGLFDINLVNFQDISVLNARIENNTNLTQLDRASHKFNLDYEFDLGINIEEKRLRAKFTCNLKTVKNDETPVDIEASFSLAFFFHIKNLSDLVGKVTPYQPHEELEISITNLAYSTSRGIIFTRCQGTILKNWILPIMPTDNFKKMKKVVPQKPKSESGISKNQLNKEKKG